MEIVDDNFKDKQFATRAIHAGRVPEDGTDSVSTPIYPSSTYRVGFPGDESGYVYSRWANPTRNALERALASLENGTHGLAFASGLAALNAVVNIFESGCHIVAVDDLYGGTMRQFEQSVKKFGIDFTYVDGRDPADFEKAVKENTKLFWIETPTNPLMNLIDIGAVAEISHKRGILTGVDNTFATPYIQRPLDLGADIVLHSITKYLAGHCDVVAGALVVKDEDLFKQLWFNQYAVGAMLGPFESWLTLRGLKTLHLRMERHSENASKIVEYLKTVDRVDKIYYPGIDGQPLPNGMSLTGGMVAFNIDAGFETVKKFVMATEVFVLAESLGGVESLINHPASMTHASIPAEQRVERGIGDGLVRLSVGLEHIDDLIGDLKQAFRVTRT